MSDDEKDEKDKDAEHPLRKSAREAYEKAHPEMEAEMERNQHQGQHLCESIVINAQMNNFATPAVVYALAMTFAALLVNSDGRITEWEAEGHGLLGDEERIKFFCDDVRDYARQIRETRTEAAKAEAEAAKKEGREPNVDSAARPKQVH